MQTPFVVEYKLYFVTMPQNKLIAYSHCTTHQIAEAIFMYCLKFYIVASNSFVGDRLNFCMTLVTQTSLTIVSRQRQAMLADCVASVLSGERVPAEIVVIDQSDQPHPVLSHLKPSVPCNLRYVCSPPLGLGRATNLAFNMCRHEIVAFTHDDVLATPAWFGNLVDAQHHAGERSVVTGQVRALPEHPGGFQLTLKEDPEPAIYTQPMDYLVLYTFNMCLHAQTFRDIGGFDTRMGPGTPFLSADDEDLGLRLLRAGHAIHYVPQAVLYHREWRSPESYVPMRWQYGVGRGAFYAKHLSLRDRYTFDRMRRDVYLHVKRAVRCAFSDPRTAKGDLALTAGMLLSAARWLITRPRPRQDLMAMPDIDAKGH